MIRKTIANTILLFLYAGIVSSKPLPLSSSNTSKNISKSYFELRGGINYRVDKVQYDFPLYDNPFDLNEIIIDPVSELTWRNIKISQLVILPSCEFSNNFFLNAELKIGKILSGETQDSDYNYSNRQQEWSRSIGKVKGNAGDVSMGGGYRFKINPNITLSPSIGGECNWINFANYDLNQTVTGIFRINHSLAMPLGPHKKGTSSTYRIKTFGPWLGLEGKYEFKNKWSLSALARIHYIRFKSEANWIRNSNFQHPLSFENIKNGLGFSGKATFEFYLNSQMALFLNAEGKINSLKKPLYKGYFSNGKSFAYKMHKEEWLSYSSMLGAKYTF